MCNAAAWALARFFIVMIQDGEGNAPAGLRNVDLIQLAEAPLGGEPLRDLCIPRNAWGCLPTERLEAIGGIGGIGALGSCCNLRESAALATVKGKVERVD
jgi:hypothetical protein